MVVRIQCSRLYHQGLTTTDYMYLKYLNPVEETTRKLPGKGTLIYIVSIIYIYIYIHSSNTHLLVIMNVFYLMDRAGMTTQQQDIREWVMRLVV